MSMFKKAIESESKLRLGPAFTSEEPMKTLDLETITLEKGSHESHAAGWLYTDQPAGVSPVIAGRLFFCRALSTHLTND